MPQANPLTSSASLDPLASVGFSGQAGVAGLNASGQAATGISYVGASDATNVHVAGIVLASFLVVVFFHLGGFRFAVDASVANR